MQGEPTSEMELESSAPKGLGPCPQPQPPHPSPFLETRAWQVTLTLHKEVQGTAPGTKPVLCLAGVAARIPRLYRRQHQLQGSRAPGVGPREDPVLPGPAQRGWGLAVSSTEQSQELAFLSLQMWAVALGLQGWKQQEKGCREEQRLPHPPDTSLPSCQD